MNDEPVQPTQSQEADISAFDINTTVIQAKNRHRLT